MLTRHRCDTAAASLSADTGKKVHPVIVDLSSFKSIRAFAKSFNEKQTALHSLILNAGVMVPPFTKTAEGLELQFGVNHMGHALLTSLLLPLLEAATKDAVPTISVVSSAAHYDSYPEGVLPTLEALNDEEQYDRKRAYGQSKLCNVLYAQELSDVGMHSLGLWFNMITALEEQGHLGEQCPPWFCQD